MGTYTDVQASGVGLKVSVSGDTGGLDTDFPSLYNDMYVQTALWLRMDSQPTLAESVTVEFLQTGTAIPADVTPVSAVILEILSMHLTGTDRSPDPPEVGHDSGDAAISYGAAILTGFTYAYGNRETGLGFGNEEWNLGTSGGSMWSTSKPKRPTCIPHPTHGHPS